MPQRVLLMLLLMSCTFAVGARADLIGTNVTLKYHYGTGTSTDVITVTDGVEVTCPGSFNICGFLTAGSTAIDIGASTITYRYNGPPSTFCCFAVNGFDYQDLNPGGAITGVSLDTNIPGLDMSRVTFTSTSIQVDMHALTVQSGSYYELTLHYHSGSIGLTADNVTPTPSIMTDKKLSQPQPSTINITVTLTGLPDGQIDFAAQVGDLRSKAGHLHTDTRNVKIGEFCKEEDDCTGPITTDPTGPCTTVGGTCQVQFTVSEISGSFLITANYDQDPSKFATLRITIGVRRKALPELTGGSMYCLDGDTTCHKSNHFGTETLKLAIPAVANMYFNSPKTLGQRLGINDMSLPLGGLFDCTHGDCLPQELWMTPHELHRTGNSVDIDRKTWKACGSDMDRRPVALPLLRALMNTAGLSQQREGKGRIHFQVRGQQQTMPLSKCGEREECLAKVPDGMGRVLSADVFARVSSSPAGLMTYTYSVNNGTVSTAPVAIVELDISKSADGLPLSYDAIQQGPGSLIGFEQSLLSQSSSRRVLPVGLSLPPGWVGTVSVDGSLNWIAETELDFLQPHQLMSGYQLTNPGLPGIRRFEAKPYVDPDVLGLVPPASDADAPRYERQLRSVEEAVSFSGYTVGPVDPPAKFDAIQFLKVIQGYKKAADRLGWIHDLTLSNSIESELSVAGSLLKTNDTVGAQQRLNRLLAIVDFSTGGMSTEADALLRFNIEYLVRKISHSGSTF